MTDPAPLPPSAENPTPAKAADTARALIERQLWVLGRLAEAGLNVALAIETQAMAAADDGAEGSPPAPVQVVHGDLALAYGRAARGVRLTIALQARLIEDLRALDERAERHEKAARVEREQFEKARKARVERIVERVIEAEVADEAESDRLADEAYERLEHDDIYGDLTARPVSEIIARICRDLGLSPDWSRLAQEAWAQEEIDRGEAAPSLADAALADAALGPASLTDAPPMTFRWLDPPSGRAGPEPPPRVPAQY